ncbi:flagellar hook-length control protein FliK [Stappia sp.]|uniref:flagellar hook-length control protein FliK n=1 Tax=Stappia sp. TaxID=1870903 RepID=UPI0025D49301|nr:flagellar hook-length control protein FliK [Stappia sp.]
MFADVLAGTFGPEVAAGNSAVAGATAVSQQAQAGGRSRGGSIPGGDLAALEGTGPRTPEAADVAGQAAASGLAGAAAVEAPRATVWNFAGFNDVASGSATVSPSGASTAPLTPDGGMPVAGGSGTVPSDASGAVAGMPSMSAADAEQSAGSAAPTAGGQTGGQAAPTANVSGDVAANARMSEIWGASLDGEAQSTNATAARGAQSPSAAISSGTGLNGDVKGALPSAMTEGGTRQAPAQTGAGMARDGGSLAGESEAAARARSVNARIPETPAVTGTPATEQASGNQVAASQIASGTRERGGVAGAAMADVATGGAGDTRAEGALSAVGAAGAKASSRTPSSSGTRAASVPAGSGTSTASAIASGLAAPAQGDASGDAMAATVREGMPDGDRATGEAVKAEAAGSPRTQEAVRAVSAGTPEAQVNASVAVKRVNAPAADSLTGETSETGTVSMGADDVASDDGAGMKSRDTVRADAAAVDARTASQPQVQRAAQFSLSGTPAGSGTIAGEGAAAAEARDLLYGYDGSGADGATAKDNISAGRSADGASASAGARPEAAQPTRSGVSAPAMAFAAAMAEASGDVSLSDDPALLSGTSALEGGGRGDALAQAHAQLSQAARGGQNPAPHMAALATGHLAAEVARFAGKGQTRFQIRMDPPELGRVDVELKFSKDGKVKAHLTVDRSETLDMFMRDQRGLERALDAAGLKLDPGSVELSLRDQGGGSFAQQQGMADGSGQDGNNGTSGGPAHGGEAGEADREAVSFSRVQVAGSTGSLDIHI